MEEILYDAVSVLPDSLKASVLRAALSVKELYEIRFVAGKSVYFSTGEGVRFVNRSGFTELIPGKGTLVPFSDELDEIVNRAAGFSGFFYEKQLKEGFITYGRGLRLGICTSSGTESFSSGSVNSLVIRIPCFYEDAFGNDADKLIKLSEKGLLIAGAPSSGKTTILRKIAVRLSDSFLGSFKKVAVIDERGELSGGKPLGFCTDIIGGKNKSSAILHAVRLLAPDFIICDEIGTVAESEAILQGLNSGVSFVASVHAGSINELIRKRQFRLLFSENVFSSVALLSKKGNIREISIYSYEEICDEINRSYSSLYGNRTYGDIFAEHQPKET